ncbi:MAG: pilus assembly protein [Lachnospiraceae bacterium]|jgi:hypothetical protein|nr:pilus assembly protein [Lachnospiraceae bacterium]
MKKILNERGSITVEMTFIFPIVFFVLIAILYFSFYMMDKAKTQAKIDECALEQAICMKQGIELEQDINKRDFSNHELFKFWTSNDKQEKALKKYTEKKLETALYIGKVVGVTVNITKTEIKISAKIKMNIALSNVKEYFTKTPLTYEVNVSQQIENSSEFVRIYEVFNEFFGGENGENVTKKQIDSIKEIK